MYAKKEASVFVPIKGINPVDILRSKLAEHAGLEAAMEKTASADDNGHLYALHREVEMVYRAAVKLGKRPEADKLLDKFAGWRYLKGQPGEAGDMTPLPVPEEK